MPKKLSCKLVHYSSAVSKINWKMLLKSAQNRSIDTEMDRCQNDPGSFGETLTLRGMM